MAPAGEQFIACASNCMSWIVKPDCSLGDLAGGFLAGSFKQNVKTSREALQTPPLTLLGERRAVSGAALRRFAANESRCSIFEETAD